jgi:putative peptide zinc metalloprotease protein
VPPGPPPADLDPEVDGRFERRLWWLLLVLLLFGLVLGGSNFWAAPAWAEMPSDRAMLTVTEGTALVTAGAAQSRLERGADRYIGAGDRIAVANGSIVRLIFRGGAVSVLCADTSVTLGELVSPSGHPIAPTAALRVNRGRVLANTASSSSAFRPLTLTVDTAAGPIVTAGPARLTVEPLAALVASGSASLGGTALPVLGRAPVCGDGTALPVGADASREPPTVVTDTPSLPSLSPSESASPSVSATRSRTPSPTPGATTTTTAPAPPPPPPPPPPSSSQPPVNQTPSISGGPTADPGRACVGTTVTLRVSATDPDNAPGELTVRWSVQIGDGQPFGGGTMSHTGGGAFQGTQGTSFEIGTDTTVTFRVSVTDPGQLAASGSTSMVLSPCVVD